MSKPEKRTFKEDLEIGRKLLKEGKLTTKALREAGVKRTSAYKVMKQLKPRAKAPKLVKPRVEVIEKPITPSFPLEAEPPKDIPEKPVEPEPPPEKPVEDIFEYTREDLEAFIDAIASEETWDKYGFKPKQIKALTKLWHPVVQRALPLLYEKLGTELPIVLLLAILGTTAIAVPKIKMLMEDLKKKREEQEKERREEEVQEKALSGEEEAYI